MTNPTLVQVPAVTGTVQASIDNNQVITGAGTVNRQVVNIGDPAVAGNYALVDSSGRLMVGSPSISPAETNPTVVATTNGGQILAANTAAKYRYILNPSTNPTIWVKLAGGAAAVNSGIPLAPGGSYEMSSANGNMITGQITAIRTSGSVPIYCLEGT